MILDISTGLRGLKVYKPPCEILFSPYLYKIDRGISESIT